MLNKKYQASVLVVTIMILGIVLSIALSIAAVSNKERNSAISANQSNRAYQNADSGVERALQLINDHRTETIESIDSDCDGVINSADYGYDVQFKAAGGATVTGCSTLVLTIVSIKSIGTAGNTQRAIGATVW